MTYNTAVVILETTIFTRQITELIPDDEYRGLQLHLVSRPDAGSLIPQSGGLRKLRWSMAGKGKRGGARIIYYWVVKDDKILMLTAYAKNEQVDLTPAQLRILRKLVAEEFK